ncbi:hypothetical protein FRC11_013218, partial [Ceratobasidium sp. 423]
MGKYLAQQTAECLNKYELGPKLLTVCMDNASNNNTFTTELQKHFPTFGGPKFHSRCGAHITNLMAKAYLSIFSKLTSCKRGAPAEIASAPAHKHRRNTGSSVEVANAQPVQENPTGSNIENEDSEGLVDNINEDKAEYDNATVKASVAAAFSDAKKVFGITVSESNQQMAQQLLPKLTDSQWDLSKQLVSELRVPLIHQVVPALLKLRDRLLSTLKNPAPGLHLLLQVASYASLKVFDKYMQLFEDASIYWVAI